MEAVLIGAVVVLLVVQVFQVRAIRLLRKQRDCARVELGQKMRLLGECRRASALDAATVRAIQALVGKAVESCELCEGEAWYCQAHFELFGEGEERARPPADVPPPSVEIRGDGDGG